VNTPYKDPGFTLTDNVDNSATLNKTLKITGDIVTGYVLGYFTIIYTVSDSASNTANVTRMVQVYDSILPTITLYGSAITINASYEYTDPGCNATDNYDGSIPCLVDQSTIIPSQIGTYAVQLYAVDSSGNIAFVTRNVTIVDEIAPVIRNCIGLVILVCLFANGSMHRNCNILDLLIIILMLLFSS
jgi:hypothetical protein